MYKWSMMISWIMYIMIVSVHGQKFIDTIGLHDRTLQTTVPIQTLNYRATYKADFQHNIDVFCIGDRPTLEVSCYGTEMKMLNKSDDTIICTKATSANVPNGTTYQCQNSCATTICNSIYGSGSFASIEFMCEGNDFRQVAADYVYLGGADGSCSTASSAVTLNVHVGKLGISCPVESSTTSREYIYDDTYVECSGYGDTGGTFDEADDNSRDIYYCVSGSNCEGRECNVPFNDITLKSTVVKFLDTCVETLVDTTLVPTVAPKTGTPKYVAHYEASWAQLFDSAASRTSCTSTNSSVTVICGNGASVVLNSTTDGTSCTKDSDDTMTCKAVTDAIQDTFTSVLYDCVGPTTPTTQLTYPQSDASCASNALTAKISHVVTLGVFCDNSYGQYYYYRDGLFECSESNHNFDRIFDDYGFVASRFVCKESTDFAAGSTSAQTIRGVTIKTDDNWLQNPDGCVFPFNGVLTPSQPNIVPSNAPTVSPSTKGSTNSTVSSTRAPIEKIPTLFPSVTPIAINTAGSSNSSMLGIVVGSVGIGITIAALVGYIIFFRKKNRNETSSTQAMSKSKPHRTESNTGDDFSQSASPTSISNTSSFSPARQLHHINEQRDMNITPPLYNNSDPSTTVDSRKIPIHHAYARPSHAHRRSPRASSSNHVLNVKDQCREVRPTRPVVQHQPENIPFAVAVVGVSSPSTVSSRQVSVKKEPPGRFEVEP